MSFFVYYKKCDPVRYRCTSRLAKRLTLDIEVIKFVDAIQTFDGRYLSAYLHRFCDKHSLGFKKLRFGDGGDALVFVNRKTNIVIKIDGNTNIHHSDDVPRLAIPTAYTLIKNNQPDAVSDNRVIRIQPRANRSKNLLMAAMEKIENYSTNDIGWDFHEGNVGVYNGRAVMIDW